ncbi:hypothetical protein GOZ96_04920 [Agrobacterium vitis]|nr:hypothetical protein [Agrobacterium vitis]MUZ95931.1 hypothetical protein [Agrobacterium vitis]
METNTQPAMFRPRVGLDTATGEVFDVNAREIEALKKENAELLAALLQCQEYLRYSFGSGSNINPYPAMETAIQKAEKRVSN